MEMSRYIIMHLIPNLWEHKCDSISIVDDGDIVECGRLMSALADEKHKLRTDINIIEELTDFAHEDLDWMECDNTNYISDEELAKDDRDIKIHNLVTDHSHYY
jgi:ABC-type multidrug transport system ATPase subunit